MEFPIPVIKSEQRESLERVGTQLIENAKFVSASTGKLDDWLRLEFGVTKVGTALTRPTTLDSNEFVSEVRKSLPKSRKFSAAEISTLRSEYTATVEPARAVALASVNLERRVSDAVNLSFGLTPEETALMWSTAPPRMPFTPGD
jgi:hypothetical protein